MGEPTRNNLYQNYSGTHGTGDITQEVEQKKDKIRPKKELFEYLSKEGIKDKQLKTQREKMKIEKQLEDCTFKPKIIKNYNGKSSKNGTYADGSVTHTQESGDDSKNLNVYEKLNKFAKDKDMKLRDYQEAQQWRELKDCTFKPQINSNKKSTFNQRRQSNSVIGLVANPAPSNLDSDIDSYYKRLNDAYPSASLINKQGESPRDISPEQVRKKTDENKKLSRHHLLYNSNKVYDERKQIIKEEVMKERTKDHTFHPKLYKSKVSPNRDLNY